MGANSTWRGAAEGILEGALCVLLRIGLGEGGGVK